MKGYWIEPGEEIGLSKRNRDETGDFEGGKDKGLRAVQKLIAQLQELNNLGYAETLNKASGNMFKSLCMIYPEPKENLEGVLVE